MDIVRRDDLQLEFLGELQQERRDAQLFGDAVVLQFDEEILAPEHVDEARGGVAGVLPAILQQQLRHECGEATAERDEAVGVRREGGEVGAGLVIETLQVRVRDELEEVGVALRVFRDQAHVIETFLALDARGLLQPRALDEVDFAAEERLHALGLGGVEKIDRAEQHAVVGQRHRGLAQRRHAVDQAVDAARAVEETVVAVDMQMDEIFVSGGHVARWDIRVADRASSKARERAARMPRSGDFLWPRMTRMRTDEELTVFEHQDAKVAEKHHRLRDLCGLLFISVIRRYPKNPWANDWA